MISLNLHSLLHKTYIHSLTIMALRGTSLVVKFVLTLFIARFMSFEELGFYGLITAASVMAPSFLSLGFMYTISRKAVVQTQEETAGALYYYRRFLLLLYTLVLTIAFTTGMALGKPELAAIIALILFFEHMNHDIYQLLLNLSKPFTANLLHFIRTAAWMMIFMGVSFAFPALRSLEVLLLMWLCSSILALVGFFWDARDWLWQARTIVIPLKDWMVKEFRESRTIYVTGIATTTSQYLNHFLVTFFLGLELTGIYIYFMQAIGAMANLIQTGIIQIARPKMVKAHKASNPAYASIYRDCRKHAVLFAAGMAILAGPALYFITFYFVAKPLALEWFPVFWLILCAFVLGIMHEVNGLIFYSQHRDDLILKVSLISIVGGAVGNIILIPWLQLWGTAATLVLMTCMALLVQYHYIKKSDLLTTKR